MKKNINQTVSLEKCQCGSANLDIEKDGNFSATIIECRKCNRMVGAGTSADAIKMCNAAMKIPTLEVKAS